MKDRERKQEASTKSVKYLEKRGNCEAKEIEAKKEEEDEEEVGEGSVCVCCRKKTGKRRRVSYENSITVCA